MVTDGKMMMTPSWTGPNLKLSTVMKIKCSVKSGGCAVFPINTVMFRTFSCFLFVPLVLVNRQAALEHMESIISDPHKLVAEDEDEEEAFEDAKQTDKASAETRGK